MTSKIKVDNINKVSDDSNIINKCGTTITLGASGDSIALASGASQTGFGRTGTVDWQTSSIKTSTFTASNGEGYFVNTSSGSFTANLPAGSAGAIVSFADYGDNFGTNALTISANGSDKISGETLDAVLETNGESATLVFVDSTEGWVTVNASSENVKGSPFIVATGGTLTTCGNDRIHTFTGPGTFTVSRVTVCAADNVVSYAVVAGGASGGTGNPSSSTNLGGGGGAGGFREVKSPSTPYTASPLDGYPSAPNRITVTATSFPITVGAGGTALTPTGSNGAAGSNSIFSTITSAGGGGGGGTQNGIDGGSGGGGGAATSTTRPGGSGNTPPVTPSQGNNGGSGNHSPGSAKAGGGGGAGAVGANGTGGPTPPGSSSYGIGGAGVTSCITGSPVAYSGGGAGGTNNGVPFGPGGDASVAGGTGGGGNGAFAPGCATNGTANTGGGGGGGGGCGTPNQVGGNGGSGVVIIRYKFQ